MLLDSHDTVLKTCQTLNLAYLVPGPDHAATVSECDYKEEIELVYSSCPDLRDQAVDNAANSWFTDSSSFIEGGQGKAGHAIVSLMKTTEANPLPTNNSAPKGELIALTPGLQLAKVLRVSIYTDTKYASLVRHAHGAIWKEKGLLTSHNSPIKYGPEIVTLLQAVHLPKEVAVMHLREHQKGKKLESKGNNLDDWAAKVAAQTKLAMSLIRVSNSLNTVVPTFTMEENNGAFEEGYTKTAKGWYKNNKGESLSLRKNKRN